VCADFLLFIYVYIAVRYSIIMRGEGGRVH
jgi:hypothetical protein